MFCEHFPVKPGNSYWFKQRNTVSFHDRKAAAQNRAKEIREQTGLTWDTFDASDIISKGYQCIEPLLTTKQTNEIKEYFENKDMYDFYGTHEKFTLKNVPQYVKMARTSTKTNLQCPHVIDLITSRNVVSMASEYLQSPATLNCIFPLWSFKSSLPINMQLFHRDADDYKFVKIFILLSDTTERNGEQVYINGSHSDDKLPKEMYNITRYSDEKIKQCFQKEQITSIYGKAGKCWLADTYGIHRGTPPTKTNRLLLQLQYTLDPTPIFNYKPFRYSKWDELSDIVKYSTRMYLRR